MASDAIEGSATIEEVVEARRRDLEIQGADILKLQKACIAKEIPTIVGEDRGEVIANLTLAYRHIEDARMRLGKVYQARNNGVSNSTR